MKKTGLFKKLHNDESGSGYIRVFAVILAVAAVLSAVMFYAECMSTAQKVKREMKLALEGTTLQESVSMYKSISEKKCNPDDSVYNHFMGMFSDSFSGLVNENGNYVLYSEDGGTIFSISEPVLYFISSPQGLTCEVGVDFTLYLPVRFAGSKITDLEIPMTVKRSLQTKE